MQNKQLFVADPTGPANNQSGNRVGTSQTIDSTDTIKTKKNSANSRVAKKHTQGGVTIGDVTKIREARHARQTIQRLAWDFNLDKSTILKICSGTHYLTKGLPKIVIERLNGRPNASLDVKTILAIRLLLRSRRMTHLGIAKHYKVGLTTISNIAANKTWKDIQLND